MPPIITTSTNYYHQCPGTWTSTGLLPRDHHWDVEECKCDGPGVTPGRQGGVRETKLAVPAATAVDEARLGPPTETRGDALHSRVLRGECRVRAVHPRQRTERSLGGLWNWLRAFTGESRLWVYGRYKFYRISLFSLGMIFNYVLYDALFKMKKYWDKVLLKIK